MTARLPLAALAAAAALAACKPTPAPVVPANLDEPSGVAAFRGVTEAHPCPETLGTYVTSQYHPFIAISSTRRDSVALFDAGDDSAIPAPIPLNGLNYGIPDRPTLLAAADLGDGRPDLLVAVSSGDTRLQIVGTWRTDGIVDGEIDLGADILAITTLPADPAAPGTARIAAALSGDRIAVASFARTTTRPSPAPVPACVPALPDLHLAIEPRGFVVSAPLGFQPVDLATIPGDPTTVWAATPDVIPLLGGVRGVAGISVVGTPALVAALNALAPTRLVAGAFLAERNPGAAALDPTDFATTTPVPRVYAVLDERSCGLYGAIDCGLVTLDPATSQLVPDPSPVSTMLAPYRAPIGVNFPVAMGTSGPPVKEPPIDPTNGSTIYPGYLRMATYTWRWTTGAAAIASADGGLTFVDLGRYDLPTYIAVLPSVRATPTPRQPPGTPTSAATQWLVLRGPDGNVVPHTDPTTLSTAMTVTPGYTPTDRWFVTSEGILPWLSARHAEAGNDGAPWVAMQATEGSLVSQVVRIVDPVLGVHVGDTVQFDANGVCTSVFEATITDLIPPDPAKYPGGAVHLGHRTPTNPAWDACVDLITGPIGNLTATVRAAGYVLTRGASTTTGTHVGRPKLDEFFAITWTDETPLVAQCLLPPAQPWNPANVAACDAACRAACEQLVAVRLARRLFYLSEQPSQQTGPVLGFTLALELAGTSQRDLAIQIDSADGRAPFRVTQTFGAAVGAAAVVPFDRSPYPSKAGASDTVGLAGVRFLVPYASGIAVDASPTLSGGAVNTIH